MLSFIISSSDLYEKLQQVNKVVPSKSTLPILTNFLFEVDNNVLKITGTDTSSTLITAITLNNVDGSGKICIEAKKLIEILKEFGNQPVTFNINDETYNIEITTQFGKYSLVGYDYRDFPSLPQLKSDANTFEIKSEALLTAIQKTIFAVANDNLRPVMNGIYFDITPNEITFVSTDAHKLIRYKRFDVSPNFTDSFILPQKSASLLKSLLEKDDKIVKVSFDKQNAHFYLPDETILISRLIEGVYPAYNSVIPVDNPNKLIIDRVEFMNSIKRVSIFSNQATNLIRLQLMPNQLIISAEDYDLSTSGMEQIPCTYEGSPMEIGFKSVFLLEIVSNHSTESIIIELSDPTRAGLILADGEDHTIEDTLMLIMPMKLNVN